MSLVLLNGKSKLIRLHTLSYTHNSLKIKSKTNRNIYVGLLIMHTCVFFTTNVAYDACIPLRPIIPRHTHLHGVLM